MKRGFEILFDRTDVIAIGEPLVRAMAGLPPRQGGCGSSTVRMTPRGTVQPCVDWTGSGSPPASLLERGSAVVDTAQFIAARDVPAPCLPCEHRATCKTGCAGRRRLLERTAEPDPDCPVVRRDVRRLAISLAASRDLAKLESACTTIVMARSGPARETAADVRPRCQWPADP